jgi:hypothetical protein
MLIKLLKRLFAWQTIEKDGSVFMLRFFLYRRTRDNRAIYLHIIYRPDADKDPHDHPWDFRSFILWGSYKEVFWTKQFHGFSPYSPFYVPDTRSHSWLSTYRVPAEHIHRIFTVSRSPIVTLVFCGAVRRKWGFWKMDEAGSFTRGQADNPVFVPWREYLGVPAADSTNWRATEDPMEAM